MNARTAIDSTAGRWRDDGLAALRESERSAPPATPWMIAAYLNTLLEESA